MEGRELETEKPPVTVVGIGASAGGVQALEKLFDALPSDLGAAFVVILHLDPHVRSELANILANHTAMPVAQVGGPQKLEKDRVYVIPPGRELEMADGQIAAVPFDEPRGQRTPIDSFFRSLAREHGDGFGVILSGGGSDGAVGIKAVKENGGVILVQDPAEAEHGAMPSAAIATQVVDFVLPLRQLAERLAELIPAKDRLLPQQRSAEQEENLRRILAHLRVRTGHDFSHYKRSTIMRRLMRRMQVTRRGDFADYYSYLRDHAEEAQALLGDLLISVTTFFRDTEAFQALAAKAIPQLFRGDESNPVRVWVPGCATGEEAYSIAILLMEEAGRHELRPEIHMFGSDMDSRALNIAREGRYPKAIEADVSEERLRRFFTADGEFYQVKRELRDMMLFANHSLLKDPPFSRLELISCRNLLIYLDRDLQQQVLATLHYALVPDGYLFLGSSETADHADGLFRAMDREARIYQAAAGAGGLARLPRLMGMSGAEVGPAAVPQAMGVRHPQGAHREALESHAPPSVLVDQTHRVLHLSEHAGRFLQPSSGPLTSDITDLVRSDMRFELRSALAKAFDRGEGSLSPPIPVRFNGAAHMVCLQVTPQVEEGKEVKRCLVFFLEGGPVQESDGKAPGAQERGGETVKQLRQDLEQAQSRMRTMREESEAANEELRAANEELQSINEEYRSTAEELETSKEELQSLNEELQTVNSELKLKLETVSRANSDLQNLMAAMDFGALFLDNDLRIKRFTPRLADLFNITQSDAGRPISDFTHQLEYDGLAADARAVLDDLVPKEREIKSHNGAWYVARIRPYRTIDDKIDGVVVSFTDVSDRRKLESALSQVRQELERCRKDGKAKK